MWDDIINKSSNNLPSFNNYLLKQYRNDQISKLDIEMDLFLKEAFSIFEGKVQYRGYRELTPEERAEFILENQSKYLKGRIDIFMTSCKLIRYEFEFEGELYYMHMVIPFIVYDGVMSQGNMCYPSFLFMDRGGLHVIQGKGNENWLIVKVTRAPLTFWRKHKRIIKSMNGQVYSEKVITVKIHQKATSKKYGERTPLILYHLSVFGYKRTLLMYGFEDGDIEIVSNYEKQNDYEHFKLASVGTIPDSFVKVKSSVLSDIYKLRFILSFIDILNEDRRFKVADIVDESASYFKVVLGRYLFPTTAQEIMLYNYTIDHLETNKTLISPISKSVLAGIGINVSDIYDLIHYIFYNLDGILVNYNPVDLYTKKIGQLDQLMSGVTKEIYKQCFMLYNKKKPGLTRETVSNLMRKASNINEWFKYSRSSKGSKGSGVASTPKLFRASPSFYNDNWLLQIGAKRDRSPDNVEIRSSKKGKKSFPSMSLMKSHPSHLVVESFINFPSSSPIVTGTINPFLEIDAKGNVIRPNYADEVENVFG